MAPFLRRQGLGLAWGCALELVMEVEGPEADSDINAGSKNIRQGG